MWRYTQQRASGFLANSGFLAKGMLSTCKWWMRLIGDNISSSCGDIGNFQLQGWSPGELFCFRGRDTFRKGAFRLLHPSTGVEADEQDSRPRCCPCGLWSVAFSQPRRGHAWISVVIIVRDQQKCKAAYDKLVLDISYNCDLARKRWFGESGYAHEGISGAQTNIRGTRLKMTT